MSKKKRKLATDTPQPPDTPPSAGTFAAAATPGLSPEAGPGDWTAALLAAMLFLAPALGVPNEEMLQDTLKSIVVSGLALFALLVFFWRERHRTAALRWHALMALPLALAAYALGSMVWSHAFLGGAEALRWWVLSVILWLGLTSFSRERFNLLAWGIHGGALVASVWTALQFWADFKGFPQGPNPASTFVNRNFFAEFLVCTLPFSAWVLLRTRGTAFVALLSVSTAVNLVAMLMTGTRSALIALGAMALLTPVFIWHYKQRWSAVVAPVFGLPWSRAERAIAVGLLAVTVAVLGSIPTGNAALVNEHNVEGRGLTAIERSFARVVSMTDKREYTERSFSLRWVMWAATARMIADRPLSGVGAGAWEVNIPLYQVSGAQLETDYYVHNEILQLLAEYGLVGWAFLLALFGYLLAAAWQTATDRRPEALAEAPMRATTLTCLLLFLIISNAGFPWRLAATGALFAVCLGVLAASDARLGRLTMPLRWTARRGQAMLGISAVGLVLWAVISQQAVEAESKIVRAVKQALTITASKQPNSPQWKEAKEEMFQLLREGIAINPHYRKLTPMVGDEVAKWGDWKDATWIWESVAQSRPYVVAIMSNIARGYSLSGQYDKAMVYLERCKKLQPNAPSVRSLEVILLARTGHPKEAIAVIKSSLAAGIMDFDLLTAAYGLGLEQKDWDLALEGLTLRATHWPDSATDSWLKIGKIYADPKVPQHDEAQALMAFQRAYKLVQPSDRAAVRAEVPEAFRARVAAPG